MQNKPVVMFNMTGQVIVHCHDSVPQCTASEKSYHWTFEEYEKNSIHHEALLGHPNSTLVARLNKINTF